MPNVKLKIKLKTINNKDDIFLIYDQQYFEMSFQYYVGTTVDAQLILSDWEIWTDLDFG